jgi:hypothetical protein
MWPVSFVSIELVLESLQKSSRVNLQGYSAHLDQPTLSRFENQVLPGELQKLVDFTITTGVERLMHRNRGALPDVLVDLVSTEFALWHLRQTTFA